MTTLRRFLLSANATALLVAAGITGMDAHLIPVPWAPTKSVVAYKTYTVKLGNVSRDVLATGGVSLSSSATVTAPFQTTLTALMVGVGQTVTAGQEIAQLDTTTLQTTELQDELNLEQANEKLQQARAQTNADQISIALAYNQVKQAYATLQGVRGQIGAATLTAPLSGTVISVGAGAGQAVSPSTAIVTVADLSKMEVDAQVNEVDIPMLKAGQVVAITVSAFSGQTFGGKVTNISFTPATSQNVVTYPVTVAINDTKGLLRQGMTASISVLVAQVDNVLYLPTEAISGGRVLLKGSTKISAVPVQTGLVGDTTTQILSGLSAGQTVVVKLQANTSGSPTTKGNQPPAGIPAGGGPGGPPPK